MFNKLLHDTILVLQFFSRLPTPRIQSQNTTERPNLNEAIAAFPIAGLIIAIPSALIYFFGAKFFTPLLAASLAIGLGVLITGALHEDGLADCADGLGGSTDKARALEIMRDSTIGTYGGAALFFSFTLRILALSALSPLFGALALVIAYSTARASMVIAISTAQYVRPSGLGDAVRAGASRENTKSCIVITTMIVSTISLISGAPLGIIAPIFGGVAAWGLLQWLKTRLGGYTGDGLGAMEQVAEITTLVILSGIWS